MHNYFRKTLLSSALMTSLVAPSLAEAAPGQVYVNLFEWKYTDIAQECTKFLKPAGYSAVQISVPTEAKQNKGEWWERYQPASYKLEGRLGTRQELKAMVETCRTAGVAIYADVVMNHMANRSGVGEAGSTYKEAASYPAVGYEAGDFNNKCTVNDSSAINVHDCWLDGSLPDLKTGNTKVRQKLGAYLKDLLSLGVAGFRIDAAKHIPASDLRAIVDIAGPVSFETEVAFGRKTPWITQEVFGGFGPIDQAERSIYFGVGTVNEFKYKDIMRDAFDRRNGASISQLFGIIPINTTRPNPRGLFASHNATVFVSNHDTERHNDSLNQSYGKSFNLANIFMLAYPYGQPQLQSGFKLNFAGDPNKTLVPTAKIYDANGVPNFTNWDQQHRWREIANMVEFRNQTQSKWQVDDWTTNGADRIAFHRGDRGFIAINRDNANAWTSTFKTGMSAGRYCNVIHSQLTADKSGCTRDPNSVSTNMIVTVNADGTALLSVPPMGQVGIPAVAIHAGQKIVEAVLPTCFVQVNFQVTDNTTVRGQDVYLTGSKVELNNWSTVNAFKLSSATWPLWTVSRNLVAGATYEYKYIKKGINPLQWETGANRTVKVPACGSPALTVPVSNFRQ